MANAWRIGDGPPVVTQSVKSTYCKASAGQRDELVALSVRSAERSRIESLEVQCSKELRRHQRLPLSCDLLQWRSQHGFGCWERRICSSAPKRTHATVFFHFGCEAVP